jgi:hypothetical protein
MEVKEIDGTEYLPKAAVDKLVRERIAKVSERARAAESRVKEMEPQLVAATDSTARLEAMASQLEALQAELSVSKQRYATHSAITSAGFTDPDVRDMVEWSYSRAMEGRPKKDRQALGEWLETVKADPSTAPTALRPHLAQPSAEQPAATEQATAAAVQASTAPPSNASVSAAPEMGGRDLIEQGMRDPDFYQANRDAIRQAWYHQSGKPPTHRF